MDRTVDLCRSLIDDGTVLGCQVAVAHDGDLVLDSAIGGTLGRGLRPDDLHTGFCITKPLLALAVGLLVDSGDLDLDDPVDLGDGDVATIAGVLNHSVGLGAPGAVAWRLCPPADRHDLLKASGRTPGGAYSEIRAGLVLEAIVERATGRPAADVIASDLLDPLSLCDDIVVDADTALRSDVRRRTTVPFAVTPGGYIPLLSERLPCQVAEIRPAFGSLVTARGLCRLYSALCEVRRGSAVAGLPSAETLARMLAGSATIADPVIGRRCSFAGGFMVELSEHSFGYRLGPDSFGHSAGITHAAALCDPARRLAIAYYLNGSVLEDTARAEGIRSLLVDTVIDDVTAA